MEKPEFYAGNAFEAIRVALNSQDESARDTYRTDAVVNAILALASAVSQRENVTTPEIAPA